MITLIYGENNYLARRQLQRILADFSTKETIERYDGASLSPSELPHIISSLSLFASERLVVITGASENKELWAALGEQLALASDSLHVVLFEHIVDKRTKVFKDLQKQGVAAEHKEPTETEATSWLVSEASERGVGLTPAHAQTIVARVGLNQWELHFALEKLAGFAAVDEALIEDVVDASPQASAFALIDAALAHQPKKVQSTLRILRVSEDAYFFFGLLASQLFQLIALSVSKKSSNLVASDLATHPYPLQKMSGLASRLTKKDIQSIATTLADCDDLLKRSGAEPWDVIELTLMKLATV